MTVFEMLFGFTVVSFGIAVVMFAISVYLIKKYGKPIIK